MSKGGKPGPDIFDIERLRMIVALMEEHELSEVDLQQGDEKIKLNRGSAAPVYVPTAAPAPVAAGSASAPAPAAADPHANTITIDAPMIGTFYSRANPESEPFVKVGQRVTEDTIVCIVEAMKVFNEIPAECSGTVVEILANDQQPVDFGKPMFRIDPSA
ncbi:Acetyl-CoA biotin carboxyl carrier [Novipirellula galeiformis]|uniref:Biotin carboxyl carrier protein of acetyl-CoA carboxylase n=1 Tax=Novipirellula galeiformis TaxID=2528004 RepID=A0A5C6CL72_9BACT|nr:acetyl-CoA carboxylase biotin carboxyl carrier protein [Novipirellula galeiformis]TWU24061.1 Acetyl-CoA biotin carboxyl carrier [Novipirellula galeiformis]